MSPIRYSLLLLFTIFTLTQTQSQQEQTSNCLQFLKQLQTLYRNDRKQFINAMVPFAIYSGKSLDDMGFPSSCTKYPTLSYTTVELDVTYQYKSQKIPLTMFYGLCFASQCNADTLNQNGEFLIENLVKPNSSLTLNSVHFSQVDMNVPFYTSALVVCLLIAAFTIFRMAPSFIKWGKMCQSKTSDQVMAIQMIEQEQERQIEQQQNTKLTFTQKWSLSRAFKSLLQPQQTMKIYQFSIFKIVIIPLVIFSELFYLLNFGAFNYFSLLDQIYTTFYSKIAIFSYYIPDIFFFITGFLWSRKIFRMDEYKEEKDKQLWKAVAKKIIKLYPIYFITVIIYWLVSPSMHAGPLWNHYLEQNQQCNTTWWRALILIDNWWTNGCFSFSWYVQVEIQLVLTVCIFFTIYFRKRVFAMAFLYIILLVSFILMFVLSSALPTNLGLMTSPETQLYFKSYYSHLFFYFSGTVIAYYLQKQSIRGGLQASFVNNHSVYTVATIVAFSMIILIVWMPSIWTAQELQLGLCRIGIFVSFLVFFLPGLVNRETHKSYIHKISKMSYPIILFSGLITASSFWGLQTFPYLDFLYLLNTTVTICLISVVFGGLIGIVFDFSVFRFIK